MKVHTYYEPVPGLQPAHQLVDLWKRHWTGCGFEPVILSEKDAKDHPGYDYYVSRISRFPSTNPREYERACFVRHLAMANIGGGILLDYDVFPNPRHEKLALKNPKAAGGPAGRFLFLEPTRVPCALSGSADGFEDFCDILCEYAGIEPHISDMIIARKTRLPATNLCVEHLCSGASVENDPGRGWKDAPMIHLSNFSGQKAGWKGDKADCIERTLGQLRV